MDYKEIFMRRRKLPTQSSIRWDKDLQTLVTKWCEKNPSFTISQLANQAIRDYIMKPHVIKAIEYTDIDPKLWENTVSKIMQDYADDLELLK